MKEFVPPEFENNVPQPVMPTPPEPLKGAPRFGADWTGQKPHQNKRLKWPMKTMRTVMSVGSRPSELPEEPLLEPVRGC